MAEIRIEHIDVAVHHDFHLRRNFRYSVDEQQRNLWRRWLNRAQEVGDSGLLVYFSAVEKDQSDQEVLEQEQLRTAHFQEVLGNRFIRFPYPTMVDTSNLIDEMRARNLTYDRSDVLLMAYGEYYERCVDGFGEHVAEVLDVPLTRLIKSPDLSVSVHKYPPLR